MSRRGSPDGAGALADFVDIRGLVGEAPRANENGHAVRFLASAVAVERLPVSDVSIS